MKFEFRHHIIDADLPPARYAQTALADLDGDGCLEYIVGQQYGTIFYYKYCAPDEWTRYVLGEDSPSDVGGIALDVDGDGHMDFVAGGAWYRNSRKVGKIFERFVFDEELTGVHDIAAADIDGDGRLEILTMSDKNNARWYRIPADPTQLWQRTDIGPAVHAGLAVGDVDGDGHLDVVRTNIWYRNTEGNGSAWEEMPIGPNTPPPPDFQPYFAFDGTIAQVCDMSGNGKRDDIVLVDAEIPGGKVWWMQNVHGNGMAWKRHEIAGGFTVEGDKKVRRGAYHSLYVGDLDGDGDLDVLSCEMEGVCGQGSPRWYIWENVDGKGLEWEEHVILDANLGGHEVVVGDVMGNGKLDIIGKPWSARAENALGGKSYVVFLENISP
ncbi:MAG: hypothetical protein ACI8P2_003819 [Candidatus Latescibacterota bacterium]|jgi:hypothetical protein